MRSLLLISSLACGGCVYLGFPGDGAFVLTGEVRSTEPCTLKVGLANGTLFQEPREVHGAFREDYVVDPKPKRYGAAVWCGTTKVLTKEFDYRSGDKIMVVDLGTSEL